MLAIKNNLEEEDILKLLYKSIIIDIIIDIIIIDIINTDGNEEGLKRATDYFEIKEQLSSTKEVKMKSLNCSF